MKIISGGQTGADRGGLDAAIELGIDHGGWCPQGRRAEDGIIPEYYRLVETRTVDYRRRTELNVQEGDVTLLFIKSFKPAGGSKLTARCCDRHSKPHVVIQLPMQTVLLDNRLIAFLKEYKPSIINIAGSRESKAPGVQKAVKEIMVRVLKGIADA